MLASSWSTSGDDVNTQIILHSTDVFLIGLIVYINISIYLLITYILYAFSLNKLFNVYLIKKAIGLYMHSELSMLAASC